MGSIKVVTTCAFYYSVLSQQNNVFIYICMYIIKIFYFIIKLKGNKIAASKIKILQEFIKLCRN